MHTAHTHSCFVHGTRASFRVSRLRVGARFMCSSGDASKNDLKREENMQLLEAEFMAKKMLRYRNRVASYRRGRCGLGPTCRCWNYLCSQWRKKTLKKEADRKNTTKIYCMSAPIIDAPNHRGSSCTISQQDEHCTRPACPHLHKRAEQKFGAGTTHAR